MRWLKYDILPHNNINRNLEVARKWKIQLIDASRAFEKLCKNQGQRNCMIDKTGAALMAAASRIGPGGAGLSTSLSPLEKAADNAIIAADKMNQAVHNDGDCNGGDTDALLEKLIEARKISHNSSYFFYGSRKVCKVVPKPSTSRTLWTLREINEARYFIAASMMQEGAPWRGVCVASAHMGKNMV